MNEKIQLIECEYIHNFELKQLFVFRVLMFGMANDKRNE